MTSPQPTVLVADGGSPTLLVAVCRGTTVLAQRVGDAHVAHGTALLPMVDTVLQEAGMTLGGLDGLGLALGPGSFTGLRTGLATFKGLALAAHKVLVGVSTLQALARSAGTVGRVGVALDARKGQVYAAVFDVGPDVPLVPPTVVTPETWMEQVEGLGPLVYAGDGARLVTRGVAHVAWAHAYPATGALASLVVEGLHSPSVLETLEPLYVRQSYADLSLGQAKKERA